MQENQEKAVPFSDLNPGDGFRMIHGDRVIRTTPPLRVIKEPSRGSNKGRNALSGIHRTRFEPDEMVVPVG